MPSVNLGTLTLKPYGVETFTDLERAKEFTTLYYRHKKGGSLETALGFVSDVLADIAKAGLIVTEPVKAQFSPKDGLFRCHLEITVKEAN